MCDDSSTCISRNLAVTFDKRFSSAFNLRIVAKRFDVNEVREVLEEEKHDEAGEGREVHVADKQMNNIDDRKG